MQNQVPDAPWASLDNMPGDDEDGLDIWGFLSRRKSFIILLAIVGAGLGYLYFQRQTREFKSTAMLQVIHLGTDPMMQNMVAERNLSDAQFEITSYKLLTDSIANHDLLSLTTLRGLGPDEAIARIATMIEATPAKDAANILLIGCAGEIANDTAVIANAVSKEYIAHQIQTYEIALTDLQDLLTDAVDDLNNSLRELEAEYKEFDQNSPLMIDGKNPHREQLNIVSAKINSIVIRQSEVSAELEAITTALKDGKDRNALLMLIGKQLEQEQLLVTAQEDTNGDGRRQQEITTASGLYKAMMPLLLQESILSQQLGAGHPKLVTLRKEIEMTQQYYEQLVEMQRADDGEKSSEMPQPAEELDFLSIYLNSLIEELAVMEQQRTDLELISKREESRAKELREFEHQKATYERRIARETSLLDDIQLQMRNTELPTNAGGVSASILTEARHGKLIFPILPKFLGMGAFLGAFLGLGLGYIVEAADRSFRKPEEIVREFGIPIVGHIPYIQNKNLDDASAESAMDRTLITKHLPNSRPAEAYRAVRTAVCFSTTGRSHRIIQVTSPAAGDGKSTLAQNFAVTLAQSGKNTIIVESDFRRPRVHKITGVSNAAGIVDVLCGNAELDDAIQETEVENFSVLPCGRRPKNPSELLSQPSYEHLLQVLRERYEYVIVDTPPVLVVTDPCSVAPRVDGVLLCVRLSRDTRDFGRRALEQLRDVGANMTGIVINGVEESDAYGYGTYNYSDYRYKYRDYSYNYEYKSNEAYFETDDEQSKTQAETAEVAK